MLDSARLLGDYLIVIVNNDKQQILKKGKIILEESNRMRLVRSLRLVDEVILSIDEDPGQALTLREVRSLYPNDELIFANGGDRDPTKHALPENETQSCDDCNIKTVFGVGSHKVEKRDSSSRINQATGKED